MLSSADEQAGMPLVQKGVHLQYGLAAGVPQTLQAVEDVPEQHPPDLAPRMPLRYRGDAASQLVKRVLRQLTRQGDIALVNQPALQDEQKQDGIPSETKEVHPLDLYLLKGGESRHTDAVGRLP